MAQGSMRAVASEDLHDAILPRQLELLDAFLLDLFLGGEVRTALKLRELPLERHVLFVELLELGVPAEQRLYQVLVFSLHSAPSLTGKSVANMWQNGLSTRQSGMHSDGPGETISRRARARPARPGRRSVRGCPCRAPPRP